MMAWLVSARLYHPHARDGVERRSGNVALAGACSAWAVAAASAAAARARDLDASLTHRAVVVTVEF